MAVLPRAQPAAPAPPVDANANMHASGTCISALRASEGSVNGGGYYNGPADNCTVGTGILVHFGRCTAAELARPAPPANEAVLAGRIDDAEAAVRRQVTFGIEDTKVPHMHPANPNGPYGSHGIIRFSVPGRPGIGVHSGRASAAHLPGPEHPAMGCVRTTDEGMDKITDVMRSDPLTTITITDNNCAVAASDALRSSNVAVLQATRPDPAHGASQLRAAP